MNTDNTDSNDINIKITEEQVYKYWVEENIFQESINANIAKPEYVFYDGPPFMTGTPHYGHILAGMIKDSVLRYRHNLGHNIPRLAGADVHGLPIEYEIEKELGIKTTQQVLDYGIGKYNDACESIVMRCADIWEEQMGRMGRWIDFKNQYKTMDLSFMNSVWWVFSELYKKNRVYEGVKIMGYSTTCGTPLSNFETKQNYQEVQDDSLFIKLKFKSDESDESNHNKNSNRFEKNTSILVWTTTPWTLISNYALCVNPSIDYVEVELDSFRYICGEKLIGNIFGKKVPTILNKFKGDELIGLEYIPPFEFNNCVKSYKIIGGDFVSDSDGTGIVHISPAYGLDDYKICLENNLIQKDSKLFQPLDTNGYVSSDIKELEGMFYKNHKDKSSQDLNTFVVIELKKKAYYFDKRTFTHNYPFCWRSDTPLIYRAVNSWFVRVEDMRDRLVELNSQINWIPKSVGESRFANWLGDACDWGISRNRFWGTPIPIWKSESGKIICISSSYELEKMANLKNGSITNLHRQYVDTIKIVKDGEIYKRIEPVFDCWLESGSMPYGTVGKIGIVELLEKHCVNSDSGLFYDSDSNPYIQTDEIIHDDSMTKSIRKRYQILPADFIAEGIDQTRGWFYTLLVLSASLFDMIPFKNVIVNGLVLAEDGKKMSKRLKNYPDPMEIVNSYGSDALRLYLLSSQATKGEPLKFTKSGVYDIIKDIIIPLTNSIIFWKEYMYLYLNTTKLNNINLIRKDLDNISNPINLWILKSYSDLRNEFNNWMNLYELKNAVCVLYKLVQVLNNGYIKMGRNLLKGKESKEEWIESLSVMNYIIGFVLNDFKSVMPFFSESQYMGLKDFYVNKLGINGSFDKSIHLIESQNYIELNSIQLSKSTDFDIIYNIIIQICQMRSLNNISLKKPVKSVKLIFDDNFESRYSNRFVEYLNMIMEECNLLDLQIISKNNISITKNIVPIKALFFKKYGKSIQTVWDEITKWDSEKINNLIDNGGIYKEFQFDSTMFNYKYKIDFIESNELNCENIIYKEFNFGTYKDKIILLMDKSWDESNDKIYYYRLVATSIQKSRKDGGLHPWDDVVAYWDGNPKYSLETDEAIEYISKITRIKLLNLNILNNSNTDSSGNLINKPFEYSKKIIYSNYFENIGIKINLI
jgi:isoleucyl-tRNA synthetase